MKFVCDRCGKKYATAGDPAPGKVYKLKCKACGHLIVVRGQAGTTTGLPVAGAPDSAAASPEPSPPAAQAPEAEPISDDAVEPLAPAGVAGPAPLPPEVALAADTAAGANLPEPPAPTLPADLPEPPPPMDPALTPPPPEKDELADFAAAAAEVMAAPPVAGEPKGPGYVDLFGEGGEKKPDADPFTAAARASLPDAWAGLPPAAAPAVARPAPTAPAPRPPRKSAIGGTPVVIIGLGLVGLAAITAYALLGRGGSAPPPVVAAPPVLPVPAPPRPPEPEVKPAEPVAAPAPAAPVVEKQAEPKARPERKPERKPAPVVERKPEPARPPPAPPPVQVAAAPQPPSEPRTESRDVDLPDAAAALTQDVVNRVVGANRKAFSTCIAAAAGSGVKLDGRRVALRITVNTNGTVTYPTLDDQELNTTEMGQCLKSAARLMIFPKFKGDPFHYEVPLILTGS